MPRERWSRWTGCAGAEKVEPRVLALLEQRLTPRPRVVRFGVAHTDAPEVAERVRTALVAAYRPRDCFVTLATGVLGTHVGAGAWAHLLSGRGRHPRPARRGTAGAEGSARMQARNGR